MSDEIKYRISADVDDAVRDTRRTSDELKKLGDETVHTGDKSRQAGQQIEGTTGRIGGLTESVKGMVASWISFTAIVRTIVGGLRDIADAARDALKAVVDLGKSIRGLSANIGGKLADEVVTDIDAISLASGFDVGGRNQLIEAIAAQTDVNPDLSRMELRRSAERLAKLQRATGVGGAAGY